MTAGGQALTTIDAAIRTLYQARAFLVREIRADEEERARRVDVLLRDRAKS